MAITVLLLAAGSFTEAWASDRLKGRLRSADGRPMVNATVRLTPGPGSPGSSAPIRRTILNGNIDLATPREWRTIIIDIEAPEFEPRRLQMVANQPTIELGPVVLTPIKGVSLSEASKRRAADDKTVSVRFVLKNEAAETLRVSKIALRGTRRNATDCLDLVTPDVRIDLGHQVEIASAGRKTVDFSISDDASPGLQDDASLHVYFKPCDQAVIDLNLPTVMTLAADEDVYVAINVPTQVTGAGAPRLLDLDTWQALQISISWKSPDGERSGTASLTAP